jgi:hypothetical protein
MGVVVGETVSAVAVAVDGDKDDDLDVKTFHF